jgi:hypothetical protein
MCKPNRLTRPLRRADALAGKARAIKCYILLPRGHSNGTLSVGSASHATLSCAKECVRVGCSLSFKIWMITDLKNKE